MPRLVTESYSRQPRLKYPIGTGGKVQDTRRLDSGHRSPFSLLALRQLLCNVFLPQGYPHSVTEDYIEYQCWDTLQALASSLTGALATEAVLTGAGVGNKDATALAATITWLLKDGCGMVGRIAFSYAKGTELDAESKKWRLVADVLNDLAFLIDLLSPAFSSLFLPMACTSSLLRCIVGVAGGATRTSIVQHQARAVYHSARRGNSARRNNLADVAAKDGSQETLVNVIALLTSLVLLPLVSGKKTVVWILFTIFTAVHLFANYRAVRSLRFEVFNRNRLVIAIRHFLSHSSVPSVHEANEAEPLFVDLLGPASLGCTRWDVEEETRRRGVPLRSHDDFVAVVDGGKALVAMRRGASPSAQAHAIFLILARDGGDWEAFERTAKGRGFRVDVNHLCYDEWEWEEREE